jgi:hypothetical protein
MPSDQPAAARSIYVKVESSAVRSPSGTARGPTDTFTSGTSITWSRAFRSSSWSDLARLGRSPSLKYPMARAYRRPPEVLASKLLDQALGVVVCVLDNHLTILPHQARNGHGSGATACEHRSAIEQSGRSEGRRIWPHTSTVAVSAFSWMNSRRGSTTSPISLVKMSSASSIALTLTCSSERALVSSVVSQSWFGFISPKPL